ncbi:TetR/AcrR family transcriptional regulator [Labedaea rhizosphaerae]|uniref:TetR family transcriptional regulator n=1 Tax=Labedaea rhizosphaerae TaxID=598644 RepID=A0A4R6SLI4_LABRH|nr:TetR/AcrR family transcriptional regulator [Labedaea rhizosphaerae]TDQ04420.1 TetR family transcriptional regulator [Labedaea rhizosphaerae]
MVLFAGQGDALRIMRLLWGAADEGVKPGPKPGLTSDDVVEAAIVVADEEGMGALSMRAVAARLGRTAMSLYTYVPGKDELVDLMYDRVMGWLPTSYELDAGWRAAIEAWAADTRRCYLRHPWVLQVSQARPVLGPGGLTAMNTLVGILRTTGLAAPELRAVVTLLTDFVRGAAQTVADARQAARSTGESDADWWAARSAALAELAPDFAERFADVVWIERSAAPVAESAPYLETQVDAMFATALGVLLDGVEARIGE